MTTRRDFLSRTAMTAAGLGATAVSNTTNAQTAESVKRLVPPQKPVIVTRETGDSSIDEAYKMLLDGADTLDACNHICVGRENDPNDHSVGYGGLPNEDGVVELDACCMHGPTRSAGSVGAIQNIRHACLVSRLIMERSGHVMLTGQGAEHFAVMHGLKREDMLSDDARKMWLLWKESRSSQNFWGPPMSNPGGKDANPAPALNHSAIPRHPGPEWADTIRVRSKQLMSMAMDLGIPPQKRSLAVEQMLWPTTGTVHVSALNTKGELSGATSTSGQAFKIAGRLGDSPIIGAGCYTDQDIGSAGATGSGEENIKVAGAHTIVEMMRQGMSPKDAGIEALRRIVRNYNGDMNKLRYLDMIYYIVRKDGAYAGCSLWSTTASGAPKIFVVHDGEKRVEKCAWLLKGTTTN
ncbi:MAG TPA: isoaspartyl peptidase/L-asparaginase [Pseudacidobacterium sp.]|jgi:N4-(beta-N-acetylglucosaminyl)-L-asparaginase|nr:isoaspartyl peptidase/L-asparaginase [Pseudacidobacterium sp.]